MKPSRSRRTTLAGAHAQFADNPADVMNVSSTGALIHTSQRHGVGSHGPLVLDLPGAPLQLTARVVRCEPAAGPLSKSTGKFALALIFVGASADAIARLEEVCKTARRAGDERRLYVSLVRRCPKCDSRDVAREGRRMYSCCQCGRVFSGFRIGFLRFSR
jgi:PilZ domain